MTGSPARQVPRRYAPARAFPAYAYLPGRDAHPTRDPRGHAYGRDEPEPSACDPQRWRECEDYLYGVDLYNHGYLWEAHEVWEGLWHAGKRDPVLADFLQGLIQCAAASLKIPMRQPSGLARLVELGCARLERVARDGGAVYRGLRPADFARALRAFAASAPDSFDARPRIELAD